MPKKKNQVRIWCSPEFKKELKIMAAKTDKSIPDVADDLLKVKKKLDKDRRDPFEIGF
jgi:hypothetical protein